MSRIVEYLAVTIIVASAIGIATGGSTKPAPPRPVLVGPTVWVLVLTPTNGPATPTTRFPTSVECFAQADHLGVSLAPWFTTDCRLLQP